MGRKGTSKRKPKQSKDKNKNPSTSRPGEGTVVQSLVKNNDSASVKGNSNPSSGSGVKNKK